MTGEKVIENVATAIEQGPTPFEVAIYRDYMRLGRVASDAEAERKNLRPEIEDLLSDGLVVGENARALKFTFVATADFDWKRAAADKKIDLEQLREYCEVKVKRMLIDAKTEEEESDVQSRLNMVRAAAPKLMAALGKFFTAGDEVDMEASFVALRAVYDEVGAEDAAKACQEAAIAKAKERAKKEVKKGA